MDEIKVDKTLRFVEEPVEIIDHEIKSLKRSKISLVKGTPTDQMTYHRMTGGLMYLIASRPDIAFATFVCARYQARPMAKHLKEFKMIFRYLRQSYNMGL
ncbi:hypothetical protein Tco_1442574 [Tanacetum coccineum]